MPRTFALDDSYGQAALQSKMLEILAAFIEICDRNHLRYWLAYGTCLGALRHGSFIPWDDDLDVLMPREDYEKLWSMRDNATKGSHFLLTRTTERRNYHHRVMQLVDTSTTFINKRCADEDIAHGVYIDIIPLDYLAKGPVKRMGQIIDAVLFSVYNIQVEPEFNAGRLQTAMKIATRAMLSAVPDPAKRYRIWRNAERRMVDAGDPESGRYIELTCLFKELFKPKEASWFGTRWGTFAGLDVCLPSGAEAYCSDLYGDYHELPPENKRAPKHNTVLIDLDNGYRAYRGKYYCANEGIAHA